MTPELRRRLRLLRRGADTEKRRSLLSSLRGADWSEGERMPFRSIAEAIRAVVGGITGDPRHEEKALNGAWADLVGPAFAAHCRPASLRNGRLLVLVDHSTWMHLLASGHKRPILRAIHERFPEMVVTELQFRLG